jgi:hypothetical protein
MNIKILIRTGFIAKYMTGYNLEFVSSIPDPFNSTTDTDKRELKNFHHIAEMKHINGQNSVEYGGKSPWIHVWSGSISDIDNIDSFELSSKATTEDRIQFEIDRLMIFLIADSSTPTQSRPSDFNWTVYIENSSNKNQTDNRMIQVVWEPI